MRELPAVDPRVWLSVSFEGRHLVDCLAARDVGAVLRFLSSRGWSRSALAAATGLSETRVRAVAKGTQIISSYDVLVRIADGFGISRGLMGLALVQEPPQFRRPAGADARLGPSENGFVAGQISGARIEPDALMDGVRGVASSYLTDDAISVYTRASGLAGRLFAQIRDSTRPDPADARGAGYLYAMLGWIAGDLGRHQAAEAHARTAWMCATLSHDSSVKAWVLSTMSKTALWDGRAREAAGLAASGQQFARTGSAAIMLASQEADAWADCGARDQALLALTSVGSDRDWTGEDEVGGLLSCGPIRQMNYASAVLVKIGDDRGASRAAQGALTLAERGDRSGYGTVAQTRISAALAMVQRGELEGAAEVLAPVLDAPPAQRLGPVARRMLSLDRALTSRPGRLKARAALVLMDSISEYCSQTAGRELPQ